VLDEFLHPDQLVMKANRFSGGSRGRDRTQTGDGEISSLKHAQKFRANGASRADDRDMVGFRHRQADSTAPLI